MIFYDANRFSLQPLLAPPVAIDRAKPCASRSRLPNDLALSRVVHDPGRDGALGDSGLNLEAI